MKKQTKIIATVGPATANEDMLQELYLRGVNVIRFNFSHADHDTARQIAERIHGLNNSGKTQLSLLLDTKGPELRTGIVTRSKVYKKGDVFNIYSSAQQVQDNDLYCDYPYLVEDVDIGQIIEIDSGLFHVEVTGYVQSGVTVRALNDATVGSKRHVNLPNVNIRLPGITDKDKEDILFGIRNGYHFIAASFVRTSKNVDEIRQFLDNNGGKNIKIISKIENQEGINNLEAIVEKSDGVMVARGDLGIEVPVEKVPTYQKRIVDLCRQNGKFVIVATHMLESMIEHPFPTRAEVSDIFRAVLHGVDSTMLSGETTTGKYPLESVDIMVKVISEAEAELEHKHHEYSEDGLTIRDIEKKALIRSAITIAEKLDIPHIIVFTRSGRLARLAAAYRPNIKIIAFTDRLDTVGYINILFGVEGVHLEEWGNHPSNVQAALRYLQQDQRINQGARIVVVTDILKGSEEVPTLEIITV